jgi:glycine/D-amino acid oxidase-like deaminating enzyme
MAEPPPALPQVRPRRRCIFHFHCADEAVRNSPLVVDPSGVWFRREGHSGGFLTGVSPDEANDPDWPVLRPQADADESLWLDHVWPTIAARVPAFEAVKLKSSWAGLYGEHARTVA